MFPYGRPVTARFFLKEKNIVIRYEYTVRADHFHRQLSKFMETKPAYAELFQKSYRLHRHAKTPLDLPAQKRVDQDFPARYIYDPEKSFLPDLFYLIVWTW